jgi:hypothetical protein
MSDNVNIRNSLKEIDKRRKALSDESILCEVFSKCCVHVRGTSSYRCDKNCSAKLSSSIPTSIEMVRRIRQQLWLVPADVKTTEKFQTQSGLDHRTIQLINQLFYFKWEGGGELIYTIGNGKVSTL